MSGEEKVEGSGQMVATFYQVGARVEVPSDRWHAGPSPSSELGCHKSD
jgi:hypothetical protein